MQELKSRGYRTFSKASSSAAKKADKDADEEEDVADDDASEASEDNVAYTSLFSVKQIRV